MKKKIGVIGGMGPLATVNLFEKIVVLTKAETDQDHPHTIIDSNTEIPDRTNFILAGGENPVNEIRKSAKRLVDAGADFIIMPCNTAHFFYKDIIKDIEVPFINMIEETVAHIKKHYDEELVGILATDGTIGSGVYHRELDKWGMKPIVPEEKHQREIMNLIYRIKAGDHKKGIDGMIAAIENMQTKGANTFIIGCTELSVASDMFVLPENYNYVDGLVVLAKAAIRKSGCDLAR